MELQNRVFHSIWLAGSSVGATLWGGAPFICYLSSICALSYAEWIVLSSRPALEAYRMFGLIIIATFQQCIYWLREKDTDALLRLFAIVWSTDIGAYFFGKFIGGPKLLTSLSPNKTYSGSLGGIALGTVLGCYFKGKWYHCISISIASQIGDLLESASKRIAGVKDSNLDGLAIPGHGGILDRIDALLLATPVAFFFSKA